MSLRLSLRVKITALIVLILLLVFSAITVIRVQQNRAALRADLVDRTNTFAALATDEIANAYGDETDQQALQQRIQQTLSLDANVDGVALYTSTGQQLYRQGQTDALTTDSLRHYYGYDQAGNLQTARYNANDRLVKTVVLQVSDARLQSAIHKQIRAIIMLSSVGTLFSALVLFLALDRSVIKPIRLLTSQARRISTGDYSTSVPIHRSDEVGDLSNSMNAMQMSLKSSTEKLGQLDEAKSEFMMIASHTLRTPITVIKGSLEAIKSEPIGESSKRMLAIAEVATQRLSSFAEDLLVVSTLEVGEQMIKLTSLTIDSTTFEAIISYAGTLAEQKKQRLVVDIEPGLNVNIQANRPYLGNAVWNIIDNAIKFTADSGEVRFAMRTVNQQLLLEVTDDGIGIHEAEIDKVFDKLHRGTSTEQYDYEGGGIGLYVTKQIVEAHNGSVAVRSQLGRGTTFTITLPLNS